MKYAMQSALSAICLVLVLSLFCPAAAGSHGELEITAPPGTSVFLGSELLGTTNAEGRLYLSVFAGDYELRAARDGSVIYSGTVTVELDDTVELVISE